VRGLREALEEERLPARHDVGVRETLEEDMKTNQPVWRMMGHIGDVNPLDYGGGFVYVDDTGVYGPELELIVPCDEEQSDSPVTVYRILLEKCTYIDGVLSDNKFHPEHKAWFADQLIEHGEPECGALEDIVQDDPMRLALAYEWLCGNYSPFEFDQYPRTYSYAEAKDRYTDELSAIRRGVA
jgi:hypothetical protein